MRSRGRIVSWNDDKGYGFVSPRNDGRRLCVHINSFSGRNRRPSVGDTVSYEVSVDAQGRPCAAGVRFTGTGRVRRSSSNAGVNRRLYPVLAGVFLLLLAGAVILAAVPAAILTLYLVLSVFTFAIYALDKAAARQGGRRTPERTLHLLSLAGGWPGALVAQHRLRHKSKKRPFRAVFVATVVLNCAGLAWLFTPGGAAAWRSIAIAWP